MSTKGRAARPRPFGFEDGPELTERNVGCDIGSSRQSGLTVLTGLPLVALFGLGNSALRCPLIGAKQTLQIP